MKTVLANFAILFGAIGFAGYLFLIIAGALGCCAGITDVIYHRIVILILLVAVVLFALCMYNNCCKKHQKE